MFYSRTLASIDVLKFSSKLFFIFIVHYICTIKKLKKFQIFQFENVVENWKMFQGFPECSKIALYLIFQRFVECLESFKNISRKFQKFIEISRWFLIFGKMKIFQNFLKTLKIFYKLPEISKSCPYVLYCTRKFYRFLEYSKMYQNFRESSKIFVKF